MRSKCNIARTESSLAGYAREFTQVGDETCICVHDKVTPAGGDLYYYLKTLQVKLECTNSIMNNAMSHIFVDSD